MTARPLARSIHVAVAVPAAASVLPAVLLDRTTGNDWSSIQEWIAISVAVAALAAVAFVVARWCLRRPPYHAPAHPTPGFDTTFAALAGLAVGGCAGTMEEAGFPIAIVFLLPPMLLACCDRRAGWRALLDITVLLIAFEIAAQAGLYVTRPDLFWWDDVTALSAVAWLVAAIVAGLWRLVRARAHALAERLRTARPVTAEPPPRRA